MQDIGEKNCRLLEKDERFATVSSRKPSKIFRSSLSPLVLLIFDEANFTIDHLIFLEVTMTPLE
jgi:hypothetical protein